MDGQLARMVWVFIGVDHLFLTGAMECWLCIAEKLRPDEFVEEALQTYRSTTHGVSVTCDNNVHPSDKEHPV